MGSTILEVVLGLAFLYVVLSTVCSAAMELLEILVRQRARHLEHAITRLLGAFATQSFYAHPLIQSLMRGNDQKPSYITARSFARVLLDLVDNKGALDLNKLKPGTTSAPSQPDATQSLKALWEQAGQNVQQFQAELERWYDEAMDRVSGWYKQRVQTIIFAVGLVIALAFNADTFRIAYVLASNDAQRAMIVAAAEARLKSPPPSEPEAADAQAPEAKPDSPDLKEVRRLEDARKDMDAALDAVADRGLPLGWADGPELLKKMTTGKLRSWPTEKEGLWILSWGLKLLGCLMTALAVSLGAPFWFDVMNKVSMVRAALKPDTQKP